MLSENIKKFREAKNLSQEELARQLHVVRQTVSKWEKNLSVPDAVQLVQLAGMLGVSVSELLGEDPAQENMVQGAPVQSPVEQPGQAADGKPRRALRAVCWVLGAVCGVVLLYRLVTAIILWHFMETLDSSVGIIGGADGPTAIVVASTPAPYGWVWPALTVLGLAVAIYGLWRTRKK